MSLWPLIIGTFMMALTIAIHAVGSAKWLEYLGTRKSHWHQSIGAGVLFRAIIMTALVLLFLHMFEVILWAVLYVLLQEWTGLTNLSDAIYFSVITFTTVGYGDMTLNDSARMLSGMEGMIGITVFGLTTATLFVVMQRVWQHAHSASPK
mgnify:FL=1